MDLLEQLSRTNADLGVIAQSQQLLGQPEQVLADKADMIGGGMAAPFLLGTYRSDILAENISRRAITFRSIRCYRSLTPYSAKPAEQVGGLDAYCQSSCTTFCGVHEPSESISPDSFCLADYPRILRKTSEQATCCRIH